MNNTTISKQCGPLNKRTVTNFCEEKKAFPWKGFSKNVQFEIRRGRLTEALRTHLYRFSLNLRYIPVRRKPVYNCVYCFYSKLDRYHFKHDRKEKCEIKPPTRV